MELSSLQNNEKSHIKLVEQGICPKLSFSFLQTPLMVDKHWHFPIEKSFAEKLPASFYIYYIHFLKMYIWKKKSMKPFLVIQILVDIWDMSMLFWTVSINCSKNELTICQSLSYRNLIQFFNFFFCRSSSPSEPYLCVFPFHLSPAVLSLYQTVGSLGHDPVVL